jgi:large subunit ribosomal protein L25
MDKDKISLKTEKRVITGKKVKKLRREGIIPLNLYGQKMKSISLQSSFADFSQAYKKAKLTHVIYLQLGKDEYPALIQNIQRFPTKAGFQHADLKKIDLKAKTEVDVPIETVGELEVIKSGEADLLIIQNRVKVECLPTNIPEKITVDLAKLSGIGAEVKIKDLPTSADYEYKDPAEQLVIQIAEAKKEEIVVPAAPTEVPEGAEGAEGAAEGAEEGAEGAEEKQTGTKTESREGAGGKEEKGKEKENKPEPKKQ